MNTPTISTDVFTETVPKAVADVGAFLETIPDAVTTVVASGVSTGVSTGRRIWRRLPWTASPGTGRTRWIVAGSIVFTFGAGLVWLRRRTAHTDHRPAAAVPTPSADAASRAA
jgi:hypothetical protein